MGDEEEDEQRRNNVNHGFVFQIVGKMSSAISFIVVDTSECSLINSQYCVQEITRISPWNLDTEANVIAVKNFVLLWRTSH